MSTIVVCYYPPVFLLPYVMYILFINICKKCYFCKIYQNFVVQGNRSFFLALPPSTTRKMFTGVLFVCDPFEKFVINV